MGKSLDRSIHRIEIRKGSNPQFVRVAGLAKVEVHKSVLIDGDPIDFRSFFNQTEGEIHVRISEFYSFLLIKFCIRIGDAIFSEIVLILLERDVDINVLTENLGIIIFAVPQTLPPLASLQGSKFRHAVADDFNRFGRDDGHDLIFIFVFEPDFKTRRKGTDRDGKIDVQRFFRRGLHEPIDIESIVLGVLQLDCSILVNGKSAAKGLLTRQDIEIVDRFIHVIEREFHNAHRR